jgi:hypothetical protein
MSFGNIKSNNQLIFLNTGQVLGIQDYSVQNSLGSKTLKYIGNGNKALNEIAESLQTSELSISSFLLQNEYFITQTGNIPVNFFILKSYNDTNPYSLTSGYLSSYSAKFSPNSIPQSNASFKFYNNCGNVPTGELDNNSIGLLTGIYANSYPKFNGQIANSNFINLSINESSTNRVLDFSFNININRTPIYTIGSRFPKKVEMISPVNVSCDITFEADKNFSDVKTTDFPLNKTQQNLEVDIYSHLSNNLMNQYKFYNMTMVSNDRQIGVDGNLTITRKYIGQLFDSINYVSGASIWDFGFTINSPNFYMDWGNVNLATGSQYDFGNT